LKRFLNIIRCSFIIHGILDQIYYPLSVAINALGFNNKLIPSSIDLTRISDSLKSLEHIPSFSSTAIERAAASNIFISL